MKELSDFSSVVAGVCFTLLGLWWVVVHESPDLRRRELRGGQMAYAVSLQFVLPGTAAIFSQVAPEVPDGQPRGVSGLEEDHKHSKERSGVQQSRLLPKSVVGSWFRQPCGIHGCRH